MTSRDLLLRAAEILEREAQSLADGHTTHAGQWVLAYPSDRRAKKDHDEMLAIASELKREAGARPRRSHRSGGAG